MVGTCNSLAKGSSSVNFGVLLESHQGRGIAYDINEFNANPAFDDTEDFYRDLVNEFESKQAVDGLDNNTLFRKMVNKNKFDALSGSF